MKLLYLALRNITKDWKMSAREWKSAMNQFAINVPFIRTVFKWQRGMAEGKGLRHG